LLFYRSHLNKKLNAPVLIVIALVTHPLSSGGATEIEAPPDNEEEAFDLDSLEEETGQQEGQIAWEETLPVKGTIVETERHSGLVFVGLAVLIPLAAMLLPPRRRRRKQNLNSVTTARRK